MLAEGHWITERDLTHVMADNAPRPAVPALAGRPGTAGLGPMSPTPPSIPPSGGESLSDVERDHIVRTIEQVRGNKSLAARALGLSRRRLYRLIERHGLEHLIQRRESDSHEELDEVETPAIAC